MKFYLGGVIIQLVLFVAIILIPFVEEEGRFAGYILGIAAILFFTISPIMIVLSLIRWNRVGFSWDILTPTFIVLLLVVYTYYHITSIYP